MSNNILINAKLLLQTCCEIDNLINVIAQRTGKPILEVETEAEKGYYLESDKSYVDIRWPHESDGWFKIEVRKLVEELGLQGLYITRAI